MIYHAGRDCNFYDVMCIIIFHRFINVTFTCAHALFTYDNMRAFAVFCAKRESERERECVSDREWLLQRSCI